MAFHFQYGAQCSSPAAIDGMVDMVNGNSGKKDLHPVRQTEDVCGMVHKGRVRLEFWVDNCVGYGNADAYTGCFLQRSELLIIAVFTL